MKFNRASGILLHPTSLPGPYGIGDLGPQAYRWIDFLAAAGCKLWQVLPLGPTGYGDSPYQSFSAFAGNPYLISPDVLLERGFLQQEDLAGMPQWNPSEVDFGAIFNWKPALLDKAYTRFEQHADDAMRADFRAFCAEQAAWLDDFALFMALKDAHGGRPWTEWDAPLRKRNPEALAAARQTYRLSIARQAFRQWLFFRQWQALRKYAHDKGVQIIGDAPIFVAMDSADVWAHPDLFFLDESGNPTVVAGVPPDYFSPTGQLWGNPLYRWDVHKYTGYKWWIARFKAVLDLVDIVRLDHFRGFAGYWEVPGGAPTAEKGRWVPGPGADFFNVLRDALGDLPIIAEDLGEITPDVVELRDSFNLPGMKIFQFGFSGPDNPFLPHHYTENCVVYTGTHDNDTMRGWFESASAQERDFALRYMGVDGQNFVADSIRTIWASVAVFALAPMQDFLNQDTRARMNFPGRLGGNWTWRMPHDALRDDLLRRIKELNYLYQR